LYRRPGSIAREFLVGGVLLNEKPKKKDQVLLKLFVKKEAERAGG
jgi:hypothetical protein